MKKQQLDKNKLQQARENNLRQIVLKCSRAINLSVITMMEKKGVARLTQAEAFFLANISMDGNTLTDLSSKTSLSKQSALQLVNQLEKKSFIERSESLADKRSKIITFTKKGRSMMKASFAVMEQLENDLTTVLGPTKFETLKVGLLEITDILAEFNLAE